jgi:hypothetical protein
VANGNPLPQVSLSGHQLGETRGPSETALTNQTFRLLMNA